eukprot:g6422.t1
MDAAGAPLPVPPCIDDFDVGQELGKGGFAVVYRARVRSTGLEVALKVVDKHRACEHLSGNASGGGEGGGGGLELACARVANEVRLHWGLKHPAVVELLEFFEDERFVYLVLQLCGGGDLHRRLRESRRGDGGGPLGEREAAGYMGQLLAGLQYLHESGVMHRDLKLSNLLLSEDGRRLRIGDFGLAVKLEEEDSERNTICGTPNYMAPEVQGAAYGLSADLWSAGCLFYAMVTGGAPFQGRRVGDTLANARAGRYLVPEGLSDAAKDFLACMLSQDPSRRMRVEEAAAHPFLRLDNQRLPRSPAAIPSTEPATPGAENPAIATHAKTGRDEGKEQTTTGPQGRGMSSKSRGKSSASIPNSTSPFYGKAGGSKEIGTTAGSGFGPGTAATAAGHSTLTASTAGLGSSDLCSLNSGFLDGDDAASFTTLRAEAVPTPATIGEEAAAAAARMRRAAAQAPFRGSAEGVVPGATAAAASARERGGIRGSSGGSGGREARGPRRTARPPFDMEGDWASPERDQSVNSVERDAGGAFGMRSAASGGALLRGRFGWRGSADVTVVAGAGGRGDGAVRGWDAFCSDERNERGKTGVGGGLGHCGNARDVGDWQARRSLHGGHLTSSPGGRLAETRGEPSGVSAFYTNESDTDAVRLRDPSIVEKQQQQQQQAQRNMRKQQQPSRRRARRSRSTQILPHKQRQLTTVKSDRASRTRPTSSSSSSSGSCGTRSSEDDLPSAPFPAPRARRRRQREGGTRASRPLPPLPPQPSAQPPIFPPGEQSHGSEFPRGLRELREVRAAAAAERRLHETGYARSDGGGSAGSTARKSVDSSVSACSASKAAGGKRPLVPFSTARVKPLYHRSEGKVAGVQVFADGRASITVGRRWLVASETGEQLWAGGAAGAAKGERSPSQVTAATKLEGRSARSVRASEACSAAAAAKVATADGEGGDASYSLRTLPEEFHPLYRSLAGIVNALRSKTPKVVLRQEPDAPVPDRQAQPGKLILCALMDNLPDPDFAAAFADGGSLSLWTRKNELRVELPSGRVRCWVVGLGSEWPVLEGGVVGGGRRDTSVGGRDGGEGLGSRDAGDGAVEEAAYLRAGFDGYCRCLREEAAAYRRHASFPVEVCSPAASLPSSVATGAMPASGGGKVRSWWRGEEESSSTSSESLGLQNDEHGFNLGGGCQEWVGGGGGGAGSVAGTGTGWSGVVNPESSGERRNHSVNDDRPSRSFASSHHDVRHHGRCSEPQQQQQQRQQRSKEPRHHKPPLTPSTDFETHSSTSEPRAETPAAPRPLLVAARQKNAKRAGGSLISNSDCSTPSEGGERACLDSSSLTCSSISEGCPVTAAGGEGGGGKGFDPVQGSGAVEYSRDGGAAAVIPGLGEAFRNSDGGLEVRFADGVVVVVDAKAETMRVSRPPSPPRQQQHQQGCARAYHPRPDATSGAIAGTAQSVTYDLGRHAAERRRGTRGAGRESAERMPRDVKDRMKALPRFIAALKGSTLTVNEKSTSANGSVRVRGGGRDAASPR